MGADSSTLRSIESLNKTLTDLEHKLYLIEDSHVILNNNDNDNVINNTVAVDNNVLLFNTRVKCRESINLLVGPILGIVTHNTVRVLVEISSDADISFNIFIREEISTDQLKTEKANFYKSVNRTMRKDIPEAITITGLLPGSHYYLYLGGVSCSDTLQKFAKFQTLKIQNPSVSQSIRMICTHNGRLDCIVPGECNLWKDIENKIEYENIHLFVHSGNLLSINTIIQSIVLEAYDCLVREDCSSLMLVDYLEKIELLVKNVYVRVLNSEELKVITRRCCCIFIPGDDEAGKDLNLMFTTGSSVDQKDKVVTGFDYQ